MKLAFREDEAAGVVRCFASSLDEAQQTELATMSLALLRAAPLTFNAWARVLQDAFRATVEATGATVAGFEYQRPSKG